jgi:hypothetical protein
VTPKKAIETEEGLEFDEMAKDQSVEIVNDKTLKSTPVNQHEDKTSRIFFQTRGKFPFLLSPC